MSKTIHIDRSRDFATIHGERGPDDTHRLAFFKQDKFYFDADGCIILDLVPEELRESVEAKIRKMNNGLLPSEVKEPASDDDKQAGGTDTDNNSGESDPNAEVNLELWLRGETYPWFAVAKAIRERYKKAITKAEDAVLFLVIDEKVVPVEELAGKFKSYLN